MAAGEDSYTEYKDMQRSFVSNLNGTTTLEISLITTCPPICIILRSFLWYIVNEKCKLPRKTLRTSVVFLVEYLTLVLPVLLIFTVMADYAFTLIVVLLSMAMPAVVGYTFRLPDTLPSLGPRKPFLCNFRAYVNIATAISILAVDFVVYPRRFAKTETFGTGLMDVGVGSFIISNAIVCHDARGISSRNTSLVQLVKKELSAVSLLLGLGLARFMAVKSTHYQEHVSEYGVHWNFFLTLAFVRVFSTIILHTLPHYLRKHPWIVGLIIGLLYQYALSNGLEHFILHGSAGDGSRTNFIDANREGICSSLGYLSLYFIGIGIGKIIFQSRHESGDRAVRLLLSLVFITVSAWSMLFYWRHNVGPISRRMANFGFVLWQVAYNVQLLAMFLIVDIFLALSGSQNMFMLYAGGCSSCLTRRDTPSSPAPTAVNSSTSGKAGTPVTGEFRSKADSHSAGDDSVVVDRDTCLCLLSGINFNQLGYFLIANLLTGFVNLSLETIKASTFKAFLILNAYLVTLNGVIMVLYRTKFLLKL